MDSVGKFDSDREYLEAVKTLINCTQETKHRINFFKKKILPSVHGGNILDIGVGNGELSKNLYNSFDLIHIVDPSLRALNSIDSKEFLGKDTQKFNTRIEDFNFSNDFYDLIVNSHTLYYINREYWKNILENSIKSLKSKGYLVVVLNDGLSRATLSHQFGALQTIKIEQFIEECCSLKDITLQILPFYETFKPVCLEDALKVVGICFYDIGITAERTQLEKHLNKYYLDVDRNSYKIDFIQYFFLLQRK